MSSDHSKLYRLSEFFRDHRIGRTRGEEMVKAGTIKVVWQGCRRYVTAEFAARYRAALPEEALPQYRGRIRHASMADMTKKRIDTVMSELRHRHHDDMRTYLQEVIKFAHHKIGEIDRETAR